MDLGDAQVAIEGVEMAHFMVFNLPHSGDYIVQAFPAAATELRIRVHKGTVIPVGAENALLWQRLRRDVGRIPGFTVIGPLATHEAVPEAHAHAFEHFGGVPTRIL